MFGARAVLKAVLQDFPKTDISISIVWIQMPGFNDNPDTASQIAQTLRSLIRNAAPDLRESIKWGNPTYSGAGNVMYLAATDSYVTLGFFNGASLNYPVLKRSSQDGCERALTATHAASFGLCPPPVFRAERSEKSCVGGVWVLVNKGCNRPGDDRKSTPS